MFEFLFRKDRKTPAPATVVTPVNHVSVDDLIKGILDDGTCVSLVVICISEQDLFSIGCVAYATMTTRAVISHTVFTLEDSDKKLYHLNGEQFLQWTRPHPENGVWA